MRRVALGLGALLLLAVAAFTLGVLWPSPVLAPVRTTSPVAIVGVTIVDVQGDRLLPGRTVVVERGRITAVDVDSAAAAAVPAGAIRVEGRGRYLLPALWDMHAHVYAFSPLLDLPLHVAYGVTNVRDMQGCPAPGDPFIACAEDKRRWTAEAVAGARIGPRIVASTSFMANGPGMAARLGDVPKFYDTATPADARAFVRHFAARQVDAIKVYDRIPRASYLALADEARRHGLPLVGHRPHAVSAIEAARHQRSIEHARFLLHESFAGSAELRALAGTPRWREDRRRMLDEHVPAMADSIFAAMRASGAWYVPTHLTRWVDAYADSAVVREDPLLRYVHPLLRRQWIEDVDETLALDPSPAARATYREFHERALALTGAAHRAGVQVLVGTDYIAAGADVHRELRMLVQAGLSPAQALHAATLAPARYFGLEARHGTVALGRTADLLLLDADPLADVANSERIAAVLFQGDLYDRAALDRIRTHVQREARSWSVGCKILWRFLQNPVGY